MRKRSFVFLTLLAVGAFLASSPEPLRRSRELFARPARRTSLARIKPLRGSQGEALMKPQTGYSDQDDSARLSPAESQPPEESQAAMNAVAAIPEKDLQQALEDSLRENATNSTEFRELLVRRWAELDPKAVVAWTGSAGDSALAASSF